MKQMNFFGQKELPPSFTFWDDLKWWGEHHGLIWKAIEERSGDKICPSHNNVYKALELTPFEDVKVVILGQDPYPNPDHAMGLAFSVPNGEGWPQSLINIFLELEADVGCPLQSETDLTPWAKQGVLLLNTVLTTEQGKIGAHMDLGWQKMTDEVISAILIHKQRIVFVLWGNHAQSTFQRVNLQHPGFLIKNEHVIIRSSHPSPRSANRGFLGSRPFSKINQHLENHEFEPINWCL